ncbi:MAG: hypothetical protein ACLUOF_11485 [Ruminococcus sp.]
MLCAFLKGTARQNAGVQFSRRHGKDAVLPLCFYLMIERLDGIVERTHPVDETAFHNPLPEITVPHISCHSWVFIIIRSSVSCGMRLWAVMNPVMRSWIFSK